MIKSILTAAFVALSATGFVANSQTPGEMATTTCEASSFSGAFADLTDVYIDSVYNAYVALCSTPWWRTWNFQGAYDAMTPWAQEFAYAYATATANCVTTATENANAVGCAFSEAYAEAASKPFAEAFAVLDPQAITGFCLCGKEIAFPFDDASFSLELFTTAQARASTAACASGNQASSAKAYVDCYAYVYAEVFAEAIASAFVEALCWPPYDHDYMAVTSAQEAVEAHVIENNDCIIFEEEV